VTVDSEHLMNKDPYCNKKGNRYNQLAILGLAKLAIKTHGVGQAQSESKSATIQYPLVGSRIDQL